MLYRQNFETKQNMQQSSLYLQSAVDDMQIFFKYRPALKRMIFMNYNFTGTL